MNIYLDGLLIGLAYVAPLGAQNMFVINTAIRESRPHAYMTAFITIFFDVTLALACFFGIGAIMEAAPLVQKGMLLIGSLVVVWMGISLIRAKTKLDDAAESQKLGFLKTAGKACVVTWFNPQAIIDGTMLLGAFRANLAPGTSGFFVAGTTSASFIWFLGITTLISLFRTKISEKLLRIINIICGVVMIFYGGKLLYTFVVSVIG